MTGVASSRGISPHNTPSLGTAANAKRPPEPMFPVWDPAGTMHMMTRQNRNDKVRFDGWFESDPAELAKRLPQAMQNAIAQAQAAAPATPGSATPQLLALRAEYASLGGEADPSWGLNSLKAAIVARRDALSKDMTYPVKDPTAGLVPGQSLPEASAEDPEYDV